MGIEKEQSSGARRGQGEEKRILMLALNSERVDDRLEDGTKRLSVGLVDFHSVDLKQNKLQVSHCCFPSLIMVEFTNAMMTLNEFLYIVGGVTPPIARSPEFQQLQLASPLSNRTHYFGGSSLDMSNEAAVWCPTPFFIEDPMTSNYVSFLGKIYIFGSDRLEPEVLDPAAITHCNNKPISPIPIPESLAGCSVSIPALPDPSNKRILMRLIGGPLSLPSLYAFTPDDGDDGIGTWDCLASDFQVWAESAVVVNGVIFFHCHKFPSVLCAFHTDRKKWLKVWWDSCFNDKGNNVDMNVERIHFDAMLHLGNNILCFAGLTPIYPSPAVYTLEILFFKFEVVVTDETVIVKARDSYSYDLPKAED